MAPPTMKALVTIEEKTAAVQSVPVPTPGEGEILVKVHYAAQNPTDWKSMRGVPPGRILGCDFAGTIENANGSHWREGQRVAGWVHGASSNPTRGVFAEYAVTEASLVFPIPDSVSYQSAAVVPLAVATAVQALFQRLGLPEPSKPATSAIPVLIYGGSTSVGYYAIQLSKLAGLFVVATGSKKNSELLKTLGADATVDYNDADWPEQVRRLTHDKLEHALDCISEKGSQQGIAKALSPVKGGHIITLLPVKDDLREEVRALNGKAKVEATIAYTVFRRALGLQQPANYAAFDYQRGENDTPEDKAFWEKYLAQLPDLLATGKLVPNKVREFGGIDDILAGFKEHAEGNVRAEKLVYKIA
ncbi:hypothetical protein SLS62_005461 [Diatrype stigma]|uniref:Enoyl reductase (ER) domain-containing protein n=1 Tax=Diatrype stigma TaxID=117547 RepID=A0AAN9YNH0_9PEZI